MATLAIVWRNPKQVRRQLRWSRKSSQSPCIVQELISETEDLWTNLGALELISKCPPRTESKELAAKAATQVWRLTMGWQ